LANTCCSRCTRNAFAFLALDPDDAGAAGWTLVGGLLGLWLTFYLPTAMRRVYGGSRKATALRWIVLMFLHMVTLLGDRFHGWCRGFPLSSHESCRICAAQLYCAFVQYLLSGRMAEAGRIG
jgi:hypothetical protein